MQGQQLFTIVLIALSSNLDNLGVGASYGVRAIGVPARSNLLIAAITATGTCLSAWLGESAYLFIDAKAVAVLGGGVILIAGVWVLLQDRLLHGAVARRHAAQSHPESASGYGWGQILQILDNPIDADWDHSGTIDPKEAVALALGLTINNVPNGVAAGMLGLPAYSLTAAVFGLSLCTLWLGVRVGRLGLRWVGKSAEWIAGCLLIGLGIYEMLS